MEKITKQTALLVAKDLLGGTVGAMATQIGVSPGTVGQWISGDRPVPLARAVDIYEMTNGQVSIESLCPEEALMIDRLRKTERSNA